MKKSILFLTLFTLLFTGCKKEQDTKLKVNEHQDSEEEMSLLFAVNAPTGYITENKLVLENFANGVIYFSDRPYRKTGHISMETFMRYWYTNHPKSFAKEAPNAIITITEDYKNYNNIVIELKNPKIEQKNLNFDIKVLDGKITNGKIEFKDDPLFIDSGFPCHVQGC
jgi:hypothetical protein